MTRAHGQVWRGVAFKFGAALDDPCARNQIVG